jgi:hypothetical protein
MSKKKEEEDAWMWMSQPFIPNASLLQNASMQIYDKQPYEWDPYRMRQLFNFPAYAAYASVLPTPLEQIAFAADPLGIVPPYEWKGGFHALLDAAATVGDPIGVTRSKLVNPYHAVHGKPDPNYWNTEEGQAMTELFASRV